MRKRNLIVLTNDDIPSDSWKEFLTNNPFSTPFHSPKFYELFNSVRDLSAVAIAISEESIIKALVVITFQTERGVKGYFSRRAIIYGGPVFLKNDPLSLELLLKEVITVARKKAIYLEVRNFFYYTNYYTLFRKVGFRYIPWLNYKLSTGDIKAVKSGMSESRRRQIKKAIRNGVVWDEAQSVEEVRIFYSILKELYEHKIKKPLFPIAFFEEFYKRDIGKYLLVFYKKMIIGGIMCPVMNKKAIYEYYVCGLDQDYKEQYPSVIATWAAIEYANQNGIPLFDFMGAGSPDKDYGVREFKSRFGGEMVEFGRFIKINNHFLHQLGKIGLKVQSIFN